MPKKEISAKEIVIFDSQYKGKDFGCRPTPCASSKGSMSLHNQ